jgi:hypothetical protein
LPSQNNLPKKKKKKKKKNLVHTNLLLQSFYDARHMRRLELLRLLRDTRQFDVLTREREPEHGQRIRSNTKRKQSPYVELILKKKRTEKYPT